MTSLLLDLDKSLKKIFNRADETPSSALPGSELLKTNRQIVSLLKARDDDIRKRAKSAHALYGRSAEKANGVFVAAKQLEKEVEALPSIQSSVVNIAKDLEALSRKVESLERVLDAVEARKDQEEMEKARKTAMDELEKFQERKNADLDRKMKTIEDENKVARVNQLKDRENALEDAFKTAMEEYRKGKLPKVVTKSSGTKKSAVGNKASVEDFFVDPNPSSEGLEEFLKDTPTPTDANANTATK